MGDTATSTGLEVVDQLPAEGDLRREVLDGLRAPVKQLPCKLFYDERGSALYEEITRLEEYYLTRTEIGIMRANIDEMASLIGPRCLLIEYGSGSSEKTRVLLDRLGDMAGYVPVDISRNHLLRAAEELAADYPDLEIRPVCADYTVHIDLPSVSRPVARQVVYFPGSTIGNFEPEEGVEFLRRIAGYCEPGDGLLLGADLRNDPRILEAAYNDAAGVTAEFNLNILRHVNAKLCADFALDRFGHRALYNEEEGRIEMHLVSLAEQEVNVAGVSIPFSAGETIWTESSYKFTPEQLASLAEEAGFTVERIWTDREELFAVQYMSVTNGQPF